MGVVLARAEVVKNLEPMAGFSIEGTRHLFRQFEELCPTPALWERALYELLGVFPTPESCAKAFAVLDTDGNGFIDGRETIAALAILSKGHLTERMTLLFEIFDLNKEKSMTFDECFLMLRRTMGGLRKMIGIALPPEKVIHNMVKQIWKNAKKHRDTRVSPEEWFNWWSLDSSMRNALKMVIWKPEDQRGLPTPDQFSNTDYTKGILEAAEEMMDTRKSLSKYMGTRPSSGSRKGTKPPAREPGTPTSSMLQVPGTPR